MRHPHLTPESAATEDPEGVAVLAFDRALRDGLGPRAAMRRAFEAAGVDRLEAEYSETADRVADLERWTAGIVADAPTPVETQAA